MKFKSIAGIVFPKSIDERLSKRLPFLLKQKRESLQKSLTKKSIDERLLKRLLFCFNKKGNLFLVSQNCNELGNAIPAMLLNFVQYT